MITGKDLIRIMAASAMLAASGVTGARAETPVAPRDMFVSGPWDAKLPGHFPDFSVLPRPRQANPSSLPRLPNGRPDFTGIWHTGLHGYVTLSDREVAVPLTPKYQAIREDWQKSSDAGHPHETPSQRCEAFGTPEIMAMAPLEFIMSPHGQQLTVIAEELRDMRRIYLDGRPHPKEWDPNFHGHSVGRWEGDTLVVDTVGTQDDNLIGFDGIHISDRAHIVERISMPNPDGLIDEITIFDPVALKKPWRNTEYYKRQPKGTEIAEQVCTNNRSPNDLPGGPGK